MQTNPCILLKAANHRVMRWRNGLGITREIAAHPPGTAFDDPAFRWRLSIADIERDCDFSSFPGITRSIMLLEGRGMRLYLKNGTVIPLDAPFQLADFSGDLTARCTLYDGPVRDFNIMSAKSHCRHSYEILNDFPCELDATLTGQSVMVCLHGKLNVSVGGNPFQLEREDALLFPSQSKVRIAAEIPDTVAAVIRFKDIH